MASICSWSCSGVGRASESAGESSSVTRRAPPSWRSRSSICSTAWSTSSMPPPASAKLREMVFVSVITVSADDCTAVCASFSSRSRSLASSYCTSSGTRAPGDAVCACSSMASRAGSKAISSGRSVSCSSPSRISSGRVRAARASESFWRAASGASPPISTPATRTSLASMGTAVGCGVGVGAAVGGAAVGAALVGWAGAVDGGDAWVVASAQAERMSQQRDKQGRDTQRSRHRRVDSFVVEENGEKRGTF